MIHYFNTNVLEESQKRIKFIFDNFQNIIVSISSGKDSNVLYHLCLKEAEKRSRKVKVFFLDQEAEYKGSITLIRQLMNHPSVIPLWYQVELFMTNATSYKSYFLKAWAIGEEWMREKEDIAIKEINKYYPKRFYSFFEWLEKEQTEPTAFMIGLRSKESLNRFRAVTKTSGFNGIPWSTQTKSPFSYRFYPIYDWTFGDIWKFISDNNIPYNEVYDKMYCKLGKKINSIRISNLIHEKSFRCLNELQEIEHDTYEKLCRRLQGVHTAALYCKEDMIYNNKRLPSSFKHWKDYRDYLLESYDIDKKRKERIKKRFQNQRQTEQIFKHQCKQILIGDWENNIPVNTKSETKEEFIKRWWDKF
ncbi:MAG: phosphoadenosine phosphosulfate reductase family protein [Bacillota bacterium]